MKSSYAPISSYGIIGDLRTIALVGDTGAIDWLCLPSLSSPSVFGALLDSASGGRFTLAPARRNYSSRQEYVPHTNILRTRFESESGVLLLTDFMPIREGASSLFRRMECLEGEQELSLHWSPRMNYGFGETRIRREGNAFIATDSGGTEISLLGLPDGFGVDTTFSLKKGERLDLVTGMGRPDSLPSPCDTEAWLEKTASFWRDWSGFPRLEKTFAGNPWLRHIERSTLALKLLTYADSGAIAAAATTSLPEEIQGVRNWDYRYSWIRDAALTARTLVAVGHSAEAKEFLLWAENSAYAQEQKQRRIQIMYGLKGERDLKESIIPHWEGYRASRPVRIGNAAFDQRQLDVYGEVISSAYELVREGHALPEKLKGFLCYVADEASRLWREPDSGIWEIRDETRQFVYTKAMAWVALDAAIRLQEGGYLDGSSTQWEKERDQLRRVLLEEGFNAEIGSFVSTLGGDQLDASNLLLPEFGLIDYADPRFQSTIDATLRHLTRNGFVYRYHEPDGLPGNEGAFLLCTFWLITALARSNRTGEARELFENVMRHVNPIGLLPEQINPDTGEYLGNYPQAFSHIGLIQSAIALGTTASQD